MSMGIAEEMQARGFVPFKPDARTIWLGKPQQHSSRRINAEIARTDLLTDVAAALMRLPEVLAPTEN